MLDRRLDVVLPLRDRAPKTIIGYPLAVQAPDLPAVGADRPGHRLKPRALPKAEGAVRRVPVSDGEIPASAKDRARELTAYSRVVDLRFGHVPDLRERGNWPDW
jgi:hypothetical protein